MQSATVRWRTSKGGRHRAVEKLRPARSPTGVREARRWRGFGAHWKNSKEREAVLSSQFSVLSSQFSVASCRACLRFHRPCRLDRSEVPVQSLPASVLAAEYIGPLACK